MDYIFKSDFLNFQSKGSSKSSQYYHWAEKKRVEKQKQQYEQFRKMWFELDEQEEKEKHKVNSRTEKVVSKKTLAVKPQELYNKHMQWKQTVEQKIQRKRQEKRYEQERQVDLAMIHQNKPAKLIRQEEHKGPVKAWQERFNQYIKARCGQDSKDTGSFAPTIDKNSRRITKAMRGKVQDRLIQYGQKLKEKKVQMETIYQEQIQLQRNFGYNQSVESSEVSGVYWRLYKDGERLNQKRNEKKIEYSFTPQINQYSVEIASRLTQKRVPLYHSKATNSKSQVKVEKKERRSSEKGFNDFLKRNEALLSKIQNNRVKQMQTIRQKQNKQINQCTFTPILNPKSLRMFANHHTLQTNSEIQERIQHLSKIEMSAQLIQQGQNESTQKKLGTAKSDINQFINNTSKIDHSSEKIERMRSDGHFPNLTDNLFIEEHDSISNLNNSKTYKMNESSINRNRNRSSDQSDFLGTQKITPPIENIHEQMEEDSIERERESEWQKQLNMVQRQIEAMMQRAN